VKLLLDTHTFLWLAMGSPSLRAVGCASLADPLLLGAGLLTPPACATEGLLPSECVLRKRLPLKPRPAMSAGDLRSGTPAGS
jgi:hypothetical protein